MGSETNMKNDIKCGQNTLLQIKKKKENILCCKFQRKIAQVLKEQPNLSKPEKSALRSLRNNPNIIILPADKGNTMVVLDKDDYLAEVNRQLSDPST